MNVNVTNRKLTVITVTPPLFPISLKALNSLDVSFVFILLLDQTPLAADEDLQFLAQLEHLHPAPRDGGLLGGLPQLVDPLGEDPVLH